MHRLMLVVAIGLTACGLSQSGSNRPDSGVICSADAGAGLQGSGSLRGPGQFAVKSSYQSRVSSGDKTWLSFNLYGSAISCADLRRKADAGLLDAGVLPILVGGIDPQGSDVLAPREYPVAHQRPSDGGYAWLSFISNLANDGGWVAAHGVAGRVTLDAVTDCSLSGSFNATFETDDGGETGVSGDFSSAYCK